MRRRSERVQYVVYRLQGHFRVSRKLVQRLSSQLQNDSGKRSRRRMETESPQGLNLHPAKQPRTTLFDWLPAGLPSVPTWTNLHGSLRVSLFLSPSASYFFVSSVPSSLLSFCFFGTVFLPFLSSSHLLTLSSLWPPPSPLDRFSGIISAMAVRDTSTNYIRAT